MTPLARIAPASAWTGVPGSGFATVPADPARTTAKPVCRLIVAPLQRYTDELLIGVYAGANDNGSLLETMGLAQVVCHFEGSAVPIAAPSYRTLVDANGIERTYFGWWIKLAHDGRHGRARVYFEAVPRDPTMQARVVGPFEFSPQAAVHDVRVTVAASQPAVPGQRYPTLRAAFDHLRAVNAVNPLITIVEGGTYALRGPTQSWQKTDGGRVTITAAQPVTLAKDPADPALYYRLLCEPVCYRGQNIAIDFAQVYEHYFEPAWQAQNWFDGCRLINSAGTNALLKKGLRSFTSQSVRGIAQSNWFTEVDWTDLPNPANNSALVRGGTCLRGYGDIVDNCHAVIGFSARGSDSRWYRTPLAAMQARYVGTGTAATLEATGVPAKTFAARVDGIVVGTYQCVPTFANHDSDSNYHVHNVVDWLNGRIPGTTGGVLAGWSAVLLDDSRAAYALYQGGDGVIPGSTNWSLPCKGAAVTLYAAWDIHADFAQTWNMENVILADSANIDCANIQNVFFKDGAVRDALVVNNVFDNADTDLSMSQFADNHSHVVCVHNSWSRQPFALRTDLTGPRPAARYEADRYCLFAGNVVPSLFWGAGADPDLRIAGNHLFAGSAIPVGALDTSVGGTRSDLFADAPGGDFTPRGALLDQRKPPVVSHDRTRKRRGAGGPGWRSLLTPIRRAGRRRRVRVAAPGPAPAVRSTRRSFAPADPRAFAAAG